MGTSYTATEIAQSYWKSNTDFDRGIERRFALETLNEYLDGTAFYTGAEEELDNYILGSLMQRYPVMGAFYSESNGHLVTIYRYSMENYGIIWIMDPLHNNPVMIEKNEVTYKYTYVGSSSNSVYTLQCVCGEFME